MFLLTTVLVKNDHIKVRTFFIFIENVLNQTLNAFNANFRRHWKDLKNDYQGRKEFALFFNLIALYIG